MPELSSSTDAFIAEFDAAIETHMAWSRRILRCAVLHTSPGADVMMPMAHTLCHFGRWFTANIPNFEMIDAGSVHRIEASHKAMHDAIRSICTDVMNGKPGKIANLELFEKSQSELLSLLANLKTFALCHAIQIDPLTELPLRHDIDKDFILCQKDANRNSTLLFIAMIDVDHFKRVNDDHGHPAGDIALRHLAGILKQSLRGNDHLYRFGGEEFLWFMRCQTAEQAEHTANRTLNIVRSNPVTIPGLEPLLLTVTIGLTQAGAREVLSSVIKRADAALYEGKQNGRDRYVISQA